MNQIHIMFLKCCYVSNEIDGSYFVSLCAESRKLQEMRSDNRIVRLEVEQLVSRRRQLDAEQSALQERNRTENARLEAEDAEWRRRGATAERQLADSEKRVKEAKDKLVATEAEQVLISQSVEELRRQQVCCNLITSNHVYHFHSYSLYRVVFIEVLFINLFTCRYRQTWKGFWNEGDEQ